MDWGGKKLGVVGEEVPGIASIGDQLKAGTYSAVIVATLQSTSTPNAAGSPGVLNKNYNGWDQTDIEELDWSVFASADQVEVEPNLMWDNLGEPGRDDKTIQWLNDERRAILKNTIIDAFGWKKDKTSTISAPFGEASIMKLDDSGNEVLVSIFHTSMIPPIPATLFQHKTQYRHRSTIFIAKPNGDSFRIDSVNTNLFD